MLQRLEVENFKSYAGKQTIGPFYDFTCVIGPNGSGKSNLMDAISFVLGVRSAQLRSTQLKDLIYRPGRNGRDQDGLDDDADDQAAQGEPRSASVTAVYIDKSGEEYRFQRTISHSGTSEYRLNGKVSTYAAYNRVLESLNILVRAKNFLVFQGDVEAVAQQSPRDLAKLVESISGSGDLAADYDRLKAASERASESLTAAFNKRRGFNTEIKQFKEQKAEALKFDKLRAKRDQALVHQLVWKLYHIQQGIEERQSSITHKNDNLRELRSEQTEIDNKLKAARKDHLRATKEVEKHEKATKKREKDLEEARPSMTTIETKLRHTRSKIKATEGILQQVSKDRNPKANNLRELKKDLERANRAFEVQQEKVRKASQARGLTLSDEDLATYRDLKGQAAKKAAKERQELRSIQREIKDKKEVLDDLRDKLEQDGAAEERLRKEESTLTDRAETSEAKIKTLKSSLSRVKKEQQDAASERTRISQTQTELNEKLEECLNKLQQAQAERNESRKEALIRETVDGFQRSMPGRVLGRVMDLVKPSQRKYETAISVVLGRNLDSIVVDTQATAEACIQDMRNARVGTATFLPLDTIQAKPVQDRLRSLNPRARLALDLVHFDRSLEKAVHYVCGNTLVVDTVDVARDICYNQGEEVKAVTEDGTIFHKTGLITGGAAASTGARRWDESTVTGLERLQENLRSQLIELAKSKPPYSEDERMLSDIARLEADLGATKDIFSATRSRLEGTRAELSVVQERVKELSKKVKEAHRELEKLSSSASSLETVVRDAENQIFATFCRSVGIADIQEYENKALRQAQEEAEAELKFKTQISRLEHQIRFESEQLADIDERLETLRSSLDSDSHRLVELEQQREQTESSINDIEHDLERMRQNLKSLEDEEVAKGEAVEAIRKSSNKSNSGLTKALKEISAWNDEIERFASERFTIYRRCKLEEIALPLTSGSVDSVPLEEGGEDAMEIDPAEDGTQQIASVRDYGIEVDFENELEDEEREDASAEYERTLQENVQNLIDEIQKMTPNMKAVDKLGDVEAKLSATDKEFDRIRRVAKKAKDDFTATKKMRYKLFDKAFQHISEHIDKVYKELTKGKASPMGGVAYLSLEESDEPYLHGIKYHAMPPMKRFRDMDQLSGGEKTMAALALLFAIHSYHPSPFFVLDEVDAALDNTNVGRIANYVRSRSSEDFQFVVISLKNAFFEKSKALVGIWRDVEGGSSKTLTLDLDKY